MILLGWEIGSGRRVEIPETGHLAWFGQTQLSGKTTALEAIAFRGGLRAVAFITKQGEGGFLTGKMIPPYFSEPTNDEEQPLWRWVKAILEASQMRKLSFEEAWIIRACEDPRQANTLADVHANIKALLTGEGGYVEKGKGKKKKREWKYIRKPVSGINAGVYTSLKAYFDIVMPQLARLPYTKKLVLGAGLNVMDLRGYAMETQALVIRSVMEWVYQHEKNVRVIVPEAQDFVPQGKNSPVKMACETLVRKAGANKNFMWLDSQDMAAVDKFALRACSIVGIGVQTEMHEIDRALATTFSPTLKPVDIARLKIGEFFVRTSEARVSKVYVQPAWMDSEVHAQAIARGEETVSSARQMLRAFKDSRKETTDPPSPDPPEMKQIQTQERDDDANDSGTEEGSGTDPENLESDISPEAGADHRNDSIEHGEGSSESEGTMSPIQGKPIQIIKAYLENAGAGELDPVLHDFVREHEKLIEAHDALAKEVMRLRNVITTRTDPDPKESQKTYDSANKALRKTSSVNGDAGRETPEYTSPEEMEEIYGFVKSRAQKDPGILELLVRRPEMRVKMERQTVEMDDSTIIGRIARLIHDGYFKQPKNGPTVQKELKRRGCDQPTTNLYKPLNRLTEMGFLTLESEGYQAVEEMKVSIVKA